MLSDPAFLAVAVLAVVLIGVSKSGFGGAMGSLSVPLMSLQVAAPQAAAIMLPILLVLDAVGLVVFRGKSDRANLRILIPGRLLAWAQVAQTPAARAVQPGHRGRHAAHRPQTAGRCLVRLNRVA